MSIAAYKKEMKEKAMKNEALRNKLKTLDEESKKPGKEGALAARKYAELIASTPYVTNIYSPNVHKSF